ncbi:MAG: sensor histidine kinase [Actinomycetota bacterium]
MKPVKQMQARHAPPQVRPEPPLAAVSDETRELVERLLRDEKLRWAYEIHDGLTQTVTAAILELESMRSMVDRDPDAAAGALGDVTSEIREALSDIREVLFELTDGGEDVDLASVVDAIRERWGLEVDVDVTGDLRGVDPQVTQIACLVIHEALTNAAKHSAASRADVRAHVAADLLTVEIEDHGRGLPPAGRDPHHFGMRMMQRRVAEIGGTLDIVSAEGAGTRIRVSLPTGSTS